MQYPKSFSNLIDCFKRLPGIGTKSAERMAYHVLNMDEDFVQDFSKALLTLHENISYCEICGAICEGKRCEICMDEERDRHTICVVESSKDVFAMEKVKAYHGLYHVLHGTISIMEGRLMEDLNIASLLERINEEVNEVIIATNPTRDGETTALYLSKILNRYPITVTRIANGLPMGSNIDYADEMTLLKSLEGRTKI